VARHGARMLPSHRRAIADIIACRSAALGGHLWRCEACRAEVYAYHSCGNRSCPRCHRKQTERWLAARAAELLDVPYFHITVTVPAELRAVLRANQRDGYALLMKAAAGAIIELARDPAMRTIVGRDGFDRAAASSSQMGRFETEWLATDANLEALTDLSGAWIDRVHARKPPDGIILDMDSSESPTHGEQEGTAWNGHFGCTCYHPLFVFNQFGDLECCRLRPGNVHSAEDWRLVLEPVIARYRERGVDLYFRADAAFAKPEVYELLEAEDTRYAIRLPANQVLQRRIGSEMTESTAARPLPAWRLTGVDAFYLAKVFCRLVEKRVR
jgi:hypothetical protein